MEDEAYLEAAGNRCLTTVRKALKGNLDGPAIGDAMMKRKRWIQRGGDER